MASEDLDCGREVRSAGLLFFFMGLCDKVSLKCSALGDFPFFDPKACFLSCLLLFVEIFSSSSLSLTSSSSTSSTSIHPHLVLRSFDFSLSLWMVMMQ